MPRDPRTDPRPGDRITWLGDDEVILVDRRGVLAVCGVSGHRQAFRYPLADWRWMWRHITVTAMHVAGEE